jgi:subtilisin family serine protease
MNETIPFINGEDDEFLIKKVDGKRYRPVRIAILDTGFAGHTKEDRSMTDAFRHKVKRYRDFVNEKDKYDEWKDDSGHGTAVAYQIAKVCPNAQLYIARVCEKSEDARLWVPNSDAVARAIEIASDTSKDGWNVDIINMSFGWEKNDGTIKLALESAYQRKVLLFASTTNSGALQVNEMLYPARSRYVTAVDAATGYGKSAPFAATGSNKARFAAPGLQVKGPNGRSLHRVEGSSYASPIAAGIAALILEFSRQYPLGQDATVEEYLKKQSGMELIMDLMSPHSTSEGAKFLQPNELFRDRGNVYGGDGLPKSPRWNAAESIVRKLRTVYPDSIGKKLEIT